MNCTTMRCITVPAALLFVILFSGGIRWAVAHEPHSDSEAIVDKEKIAAPALPLPFPKRRPIDAGVALDAEVESALRLATEYRRLMEYLLIIAENRGLASHTILPDPVKKTVYLLDEFEDYALQVNVALQSTNREASGPSARSPLVDGFAKKFRALRKELDRQIGKHYEHLGIPMVKVTDDGLVCDRTAIRLGAFAGTQTAVFILCGATQQQGDWSVRLGRAAEPAGEKDHGVTLPALPGGLVPLSIDQIVGKTGGARSVEISFRPDGAAKQPVSLTVPLQIEAIEPAVVEIECVDGKTSQNLACRIQVRDRYGIIRSPLGARTTDVPRPFSEKEWNTHYRYPGEKFFYGRDRLRVTLPPGPALVRVLHGFEYKVDERRLNPATGETVRLRIPMERWIDMPARGWRCGQTHMHSQNLMPVNDDSGWEIVPEAEGLDISYLLTYQQHGEVFTNEYAIGPLTHLSHPGRRLSVGEEFRHATRGHMTFNGLVRIVEPISTGMLRGWGESESPSNAEAIEEAHSQGAIAAYAHLNSMSGFISSEELPIDAALGLVDAGEVMGAGGGYQYWYPLLNCGIRIGATAGPDWNLEDCCRVYVDLGGQQFTEMNWLDGLRKHRTFVTTGPMLFLKVNGQGPGSVISGRDAQTLKTEAEALSAYPLERLELVANGKVVATHEPEADKRTLTLETEYRPGRNGWIAARCFGEGNAHTSAVYIELNDKPVDAIEDAKLLRGFAMKALAQAERSRNYPSEAARKNVLERFRKGIAYYDEIIARGTP